MKKTKKKSMKKSMKKTIKKAVLTLLLLTLGVSTVLLAYLHFFAPDGEPSGEWTARLDMTEYAAATAYGWLQDIEAVSISLEDLESRMQGLNVQVELVLEQEGRGGGTFYSNVLLESYDACEQTAYEAFAAVFRELVAERLRMAGCTDSLDMEAVEALVAETFGMSTVSYLLTCGPALLPSLEDLQVCYDGSGTYEVKEGILTRQFDADWGGGVRMEYYARTDDRLVLLEEIGSAAADTDSAGLVAEDYPIAYTLKEPQEQ